MRNGRSILCGAILAGVVGFVPIAPAEEKPKYSGFLEDYSGLVEEADSNLIYNYVYVKPGADLSGYTKFLIDSITVFPSPEADFKGINANELTLLEKYFRDAMGKALTENNGYEVVEEPGPGVMRIEQAMGYSAQQLRKRIDTIQGKPSE